jgi:hypothetical protein
MLVTQGNRKNFLLLVAAFVIVQAAESLVKSQTFKMIQSSNGEKLCATDEPTSVQWIPVDSFMQCGVQCINRYSCFAYNFNRQLGKCDLFQCRIPKNYTVILGCTSYLSTSGKV